MRWQKPCLFFLYVIILSGISSCSQGINENGHIKLDKNQILEIAKAEAMRRGFDVNKLDIVETMNTEVWKKKWNTTLKSNPHLMDPTIDRDFTTVYFEPKNKMQLGGDLWVLVDNATGEVIFALPGK